MDECDGVFEVCVCVTERVSVCASMCGKRVRGTTCTMCMINVCMRDTAK